MITSHHQRLVICSFTPTWSHFVLCLEQLYTFISSSRAGWCLDHLCFALITCQKTSFWFFQWETLVTKWKPFTENAFSPHRFVDRMWIWGGVQEWFVIGSSLHTASVLPLKRDRDMGNLRYSLPEPTDWQLICCRGCHLVNCVIKSFTIISYGKLLLTSFSNLNTFSRTPSFVAKARLYIILTFPSAYFQPWDHCCRNICILNNVALEVIHIFG